MPLDYKPLPSSMPHQLRTAESVLFPTPDRGTGLQLVHARFPGGEYVATGWYRTDDIGTNGTGRTEKNCQRILSVFFDTDIVGLFKAKYLAAGKPSLGDKVSAWKQAMYRYNGERLEAAKQKHGALVYDALHDTIGAPTAVVDSGWGWHYFYAVAGDAADPANLSRLADLHDRVRPVIHDRVAAAWGCDFPDPVLDATRDAGTRVVRRWWSQNTKAPQHRGCVPVYATPRRWTLEDVEHITASLPVLSRQRAPRAPRQPRLASDTGRPPAAAPALPIPPKGEPLDFDQHQHAGRTWMEVVEGLEVGGTCRVTCPFGGSTMGSGFLSRKTQRRALFRSNALGRTYWSKRLILGKGRAALDEKRDADGNPKGVRDTISNVYRLLREDDQLDLWTCSFRQLPMLGNELLDPKAMQTRVRMLAEDAYGWNIKVARADVECAILDVCEETRRNGVAELLESLKWDGEKRLYKWLAKSLGVPHNQLMSAYGRRWFISLVARVMSPGCKVDSMLVVLGRQGIGKSSLFKQIAGALGDDLFVDTTVDWRRKDSRDALRGTLIFEDAELESFRRVGVDLMKNVLSSEVDTYRAAYGRTRERFPRTALIVGTANPVDILKDQTGNRRFWLVNAYQSARTMYDHRWVSECLEQLYAEALTLYREHVACPSESTQWWLTAEEQAISDADNQQALQEDLIAQAAERVYEQNNGAIGSWFTAMDFVVEYAATHGLTSPSNRQLQGMVQKASHSLRAAGFERQKVTNPASGQRANWYLKVTSLISRDDPDNGLSAISTADPTPVHHISAVAEI